jgi:addiction module HigA family antidote
MKKNIKAIHPGTTLIEDFMLPYEISANQLGKYLGIPSNRISEIVKGKRSITADTAIRLAKFFGTSADFWMNLQSHYELELAEEKTKVEIRKIKLFNKVFFPSETQFA